MHEYEIYSSEENAKLFLDMSKAYGFEPYGVPTTIIGDEYLIGFDTGSSLKITSMIDTCIESGCIDAGSKVGIINEEIKNKVEKKEQAIEISKTNNIVQDILKENPDLEATVVEDRDFTVTWQGSTITAVVYVNRTSGEIIKTLQQKQNTQQDITKYQETSSFLLNDIGTPERGTIITIILSIMGALIAYYYIKKK